MSQKILDHVKPGVIAGDDVRKVFKIAKENQFALPAVNVVSTNSVNAVMEAAKEVNSPIIIQFSNGGAIFYAGKGLPNDDQQAAIAGGISGAKHVHMMSELLWCSGHSAYRSCCKKTSSLDRWTARLW